MGDITQLTKEQFDALMDWLSSNREEAGDKYESIRLGLIRYFRYKGCSNEDELADETINRVARKLPNLDLTTGNKPITYFYGFAAKIFFEELKRNKKESDFENNLQTKNSNDNSEEDENKFNCLEKCLNKLPQSERELVTNYYSKDKSEKFESRRKIAESLNISINTLHVKIYRQRKALGICIEKCLGEKSL